MATKLRSDFLHKICKQLNLIFYKLHNCPSFCVFYALLKLTRNLCEKGKLKHLEENYKYKLCPQGHTRGCCCGYVHAHRKASLPNGNNSTFCRILIKFLRVFLSASVYTTSGRRAQRLYPRGVFAPEHLSRGAKEKKARV